MTTRNPEILKPYVLLTGTRKDPQVDRLHSALVDLRIDVSVLDYLNSSFSLDVSRAGEVSLIVNGNEIPRHAAVFDRVLLSPRTKFYPPGEAGEANFIAEEYRALYGVIATCFRGAIINSLEARSCKAKPYQQVIAARCGFRVPATRVTNERRGSLDFVERHEGKAIIKSLGRGMYYGISDPEDTYLVMTNQISVADIERDLTVERGVSPSLLQEEIKKSYELRIVYIAGKMFSFRINSQHFKSSSVDWRRRARNLEFVITDVPDHICFAIRRLMDALSFVSGHIDIVVDEQGEFWFLECNDQGAWVWLDNLVERRISAEYAHCLAKMSLENGRRIAHGA